MRVLHIDTGREMRGGQRQVLLLLRGLGARGHANHLLAREESPLWHAARSAGVPVSPVRLCEVWTRRKNADLVHAHDSRGHTLAAIAAAERLVVSRRVAFPVGRSWASHWKYARAWRYQAVSRFVAAELERAGVAADRIDVVPDGVDQDAVPIASWDPANPIVALDSPDPSKGSDLVRQAAALAGAEVFFSDNLGVDLARASVFLYLTRSEGFGSAALLAMSLGVPVVASRVGGLPEAIEDGSSGLLVSLDAAEAAAALRRLRSDPNLARTLIANGRKRVAEHFTAAHLIDRTLASYERALSG